MQCITLHSIALHYIVINKNLLFIALQCNSWYILDMASTQKCFRFENELLEAVEEAQKEEHLGLSALVKRALWFYLEGKHPEKAKKAKEKLYNS